MEEKKKMEKYYFQKQKKKKKKKKTTYRMICTEYLLKTSEFQKGQENLHTIG